MKGLINDQTLDFDIHHAGDGQVSSTKGLHMHKRMNGKRYKGVDVRFPLNEKDQIEFMPKSTPTLVQRQIINEIKSALNRDIPKRGELVKIIIREIERYSEGETTKERVNQLRQGAKRIAKIFSKNSKIEEELMQEANERIEIFITKHKKMDTGDFYVKQDLVRNRIKVSDNIEDLNYGNEKRNFH